MEELLHVKLLRWGNSYGLRISSRDVERLGLHAGQPVRAMLVTDDDEIEVTHSTFRSGHRRTSEHHDELLYGRGGNQGPRERSGGGDSESGHGGQDS